MAIGETYNPYNRGKLDSYVRYDHEDGWVFLVLEGDSWSTLVFEDEEDAEHFLATGRTRYIHAKTQLTEWLPNSLRRTGDAWVRDHDDEDDDDPEVIPDMKSAPRAEGPASRPVIKLPEM